MPHSRVFRPYRAVGLVANQLPLLVRYVHRRQEHLIVTCIGDAFHTYSGRQLRLLSVSRRHEAQIEAMAADREYVYTAVGGRVRAWLRGTELAHSYPPGDHPVSVLVSFGAHLVCVDSTSVLRVFDIHSQQVYSEHAFDAAAFRVTAALHPSTYINKLVLGSEQGPLLLWNVARGAPVHQFAGWQSAVVCLAQAPALDTVAIGLQSGAIHVHNLRYDQTLFSFQQQWGAVTGLAFRSDGPAVMVSASGEGHLALWDLDERRLAAQMWHAHGGAVSSVCVLPGQPMMLTTSVDNSLKVWTLDMPDGSGRLLRQRQGHSSPPSVARFYGEHGHIISAARDSYMRVFSSENDSLAISLGRGSFNRKLSKKRRRHHSQDQQQDSLALPAIVGLASETRRQKQWDNIVAVHEGLATASTWSYERRCLGQHLLCHRRFRRQPLLSAVCTCCDVTSCGNFALLGYSSGHVDRFNLQSGAWRGSLTAAEGGTDKGGQEGAGEAAVAHSGAVRGVASSTLARIALSVGADGRLCFWRLGGGGGGARQGGGGRLLHELALGEAASRLVLHRPSGLAAVALDNFTLLVVDAATRTVVRRFEQCGAVITDLLVSPDGCWLLAAAADCTVRVWSLADAALVDVLRTDSVVTSLAMGPAGRLLATTHVDRLGVYLWTNRTLFDPVSLPSLADDHVAAVTCVPTALPEESAPSQEATDDREQQQQQEEEDCLLQLLAPSEQIDDQLVTLAQLPESRWAHLLKLDLILQRNKPRQAVIVPAKAPFFLPSVTGAKSGSSGADSSSTAAAAGAPVAEPAGGERSSRVQHSLAPLSADLTSRLLLATDRYLSPAALQAPADHSADDQLLCHLLSMKPVELEAALRQLRPAEPEPAAAASSQQQQLSSCQLARLLLQFLDRQLVRRRHFEFIEACLAVYLKVAGSGLACGGRFLSELRQLRVTQRQVWHKVDSQITMTLCLTGFLKSSTFG